jgi:hypothetical protein
VNKLTLLLVLTLLVVVTPQAFGSIMNANFEQNNTGEIPFILSPGPGACSIYGTGQATVEKMLGANTSKLLVLRDITVGERESVGVYLAPEHSVTGNLLIEWDAIVAEASGVDESGDVYSVCAVGGSPGSGFPVAWDIPLINDNYYSCMSETTAPMILNAVQHFVINMNTNQQTYSLTIDGQVMANEQSFNNLDTTTFNGIIIETYWDSTGVIGIDNLTVNAVPIPPAIFLFGSGFLGLAGVRKKIRSGRRKVATSMQL